MELEDFADPWEHVRMLQDAQRNEVILAALRAHAPGARVLEVGTGMGLFACAAAKLGAKKVYAVELSEMAEVARALVRANGLEDRVEVIADELSEVEPRQVDLVFGELLNADPFAEGLLETYAHAREWLAPGGRILPSSLRLSVALVEDVSSVEVLRARAQVQAIGDEFGLETHALDSLLLPGEPYRYLAPSIQSLASAPLIDLDLTRDVELPRSFEVSVRVLARARVGGAAVLFEAPMGDKSFTSGGHFGILVQGFPEAIELPPGASLDLRVELDEEDRFVILPRSVAPA